MNFTHFCKRESEKVCVGVCVCVREQQADHLHCKSQSDEAHDHIQDEHLSAVSLLDLDAWESFSASSCCSGAVPLDRLGGSSMSRRQVQTRLS